jgi:dolichol-phosphate mannosyltransferase
MKPNDSVNEANVALFDHPFQTSLLDISIIVPTRNEVGNIMMLLSKIELAVTGLSAEVIFVDDSSDETPQTIEAAVPLFPNLRIRLFHRAEQQRVGGLGGAVLLGLRNVHAEYACIMDGDLQHPPELIPTLLQTAHQKNVDLVTASRRAEESHVAGLNISRNLISRGLDLVARTFFPRRLRGVSDPLTGFFLVRVDAVDLLSLHPNGFKVLLEILVRNPKLRKAEVPFNFAERFSGKSKASTKEAFNYLKQLWTLKFGESSLRLTGFMLIGATGIVVNSFVLYLVTARLNVYYLLSVIVATIASTLWNFSWIEFAIYKTGHNPQGRIRRFAYFSLMNIGALTLRGPLIYVLTSLLGINYLISNLFSLVVLVFARFLVSDNMIWRQSLPTTVKKTYAYDIHNLVSVVSEGELPELEPFRVFHDILEPTIRVRIGIPPSPKSIQKEGQNYLRFREVFGHLGFEVGIWMGDKVDVLASPLLRLSPHVLYTNVVEPILRWTFVKKGYALVHGASLAFGEEAFLITARTDTGKTTTLLKILSHQRRNNDRAAFLSDDMTIVSPQGVAMTYPKPLTISAHTLSAINADTLTFREKLALPIQSRIHSRTGRKVAGLLNKTLLPAATINMMLQMVIPPPKYFVNKLIPRVKLTQTANISGMFIIERSGEGTISIKNSDALEILLSNCEDAYGFPPYNSLKEFLYHYNGTDLRKNEQKIIRSAFGGLPATMVRSNKLDWWCLIPTFIDDKVASDCACVDNRTMVSARNVSLRPM